MNDNKRYKVIRHYQNDRPTRTMRKDLTLKQAQEHCSDPETSSKTAAKACHNSQTLIDKWDALQKHWFDGYTEQ
jgi:hypothetical protein